MYIEILKHCEYGEKGDRVSESSEVAERLISDGTAKEIVKEKGLPKQSKGKAKKK